MTKFDLQLVADGRRLGYRVGETFTICQCIQGSYARDLVQAYQCQRAAYRQVVEALQAWRKAYPQNVRRGSIGRLLEWTERALAYATAGQEDKP